MSTAVVLITRDLRVRDQPALATAARECDRIVPLFVLDEELLRGSCSTPNRLAFLLDSMRDLDRSLGERGGRLVVRRGDPLEQALAVAAECGATSLHLSEDVSAYAQRRQQRLATACERARLDLRMFPGVTAVPPGELTPAGGDHYRVFTPYWRAWRQHGHRKPLTAPRRVVLPPDLEPGRIPTLSQLTSGAPSPELPHGGESAARRRLEVWLRRDGPSLYGATRDDLVAPTTSRLSADLHFGCLSPAALLARVEARSEDDAFARQLCWRDFHHQVLAARPDISRDDYRPRGDSWRRDEGLFEAWARGLTGYPIVDAGMRQLAREGYMHNRARMIVASFLTKTLYIDWRLGAAHFASLLVDADVANNVGNWQWVAGTGTDTRPNRVLNPIRQARRFDGAGEFVRHYVTELEAIPGGDVHEPWLLDAGRRRGLDYPQRVVDHATAAGEFRQRRSGG